MTFQFFFIPTLSSLVALPLFSIGRRHGQDVFFRPARSDKEDQHIGGGARGGTHVYYVRCGRGTYVHACMWEGQRVGVFVERGGRREIPNVL